MLHSALTHFMLELNIITQSIFMFGAVNKSISLSVVAPFKVFLVGFRAFFGFSVDFFQSYLIRSDFIVDFLYPDLSRSNIATFRAEVFHPSQGKLAEVAVLHSGTVKIGGKFKFEINHFSGKRR